MRFKWLYFLLSGLVIVPGLISLLCFGLRPAVDFAGGSLLEYRLEEAVEADEVGEKLKSFEIKSIQLTGNKTVLLRLATMDKDGAVEIKRILEGGLGQKLEEVRQETVGPILGRELLVKTLIGVVLAAGFILFYVTRQFKEVRFGICAILAMFHDSLVLLGIFSILGHFGKVEVDTLFVTAMLTVLSFSVHDTVVVYDRIRESAKLSPGVDFESLANKAVTETLSRSLNNSLTIIFMLVALFLLGGETIKWFVLALLIGTISGTYSSTFTAVPLLVVWQKWKFRS
ncbi:MAG: protein translocase subunit SecF [Candidatus Shapirobacteria bacterium]